MTFSTSLWRSIFRYPIVIGLVMRLALASQLRIEVIGGEALGAITISFTLHPRNDMSLTLGAEAKLT